MSFKRKLVEILTPEIPNYHGEEVIGELNGYEYVGWVVECRSPFYLIQKLDGGMQLVKNIRRKCDFGRRQ
jgi:hypothetical protein